MSSNGPEYRTRYGVRHPERVENELWERAVRDNWTGYQLQQHLHARHPPVTFGQNFSTSQYREQTPGPFWSWDRFGRTSTALLDGRVIHIAGEHEDFYDPDFCIYNDVVVEHPQGRYEFYLYPADAFPPTDFHTATLKGDTIWLVGSLGYRDLRKPGTTQVLRLDTATLRFETVDTTGDGPGWISRHTTELFGENSLVVVGGLVQTDADYKRNEHVFELDLTTLAWRRRPFAD